jgi:hypothetical protein
MIFKEEVGAAKNPSDRSRHSIYVTGEYQTHIAVTRHCRSDWKRHRREGDPLAPQSVREPLHAVGSKLSDVNQRPALSLRL